MSEPDSNFVSDFAGWKVLSARSDDECWSAEKAAVVMLPVTSQTEPLRNLFEMICISKDGLAGEVAMEGEVDASYAMFAECITDPAVKLNSTLNAGS